ncbi:MAG: hypothetical protein LBG97_09385 [Coriobacteriales bacterium]|nr:hypothetical protein [Coriobacteriales bacterium]
MPKEDLQNNAIDLRWRVVAGNLPLRQRHLRSLLPLDLPAPLHAWVHERLEWAQANLLDNSKRDAVLCLHIDPKKEITVSLEDVSERPILSLEDIICTENQGIKLANYAGTVWLHYEDELIAATDELVCAMDTLTRDLAQTQKIPVKAVASCAELLSKANACFLISDEFGFVPIAGSSDLVSNLQAQLSKVIP